MGWSDFATKYGDSSGNGQGGNQGVAPGRKTLTANLQPRPPASSVAPSQLIAPGTREIDKTGVGNEALVAMIHDAVNSVYGSTAAWTSAAVKNIGEPIPRPVPSFWERMVLLGVTTTLGILSDGATTLLTGVLKSAIKGHHGGEGLEMAAHEEGEGGAADSIIDNVMDKSAGFIPEQAADFAKEKTVPETEAPELDGASSGDTGLGDPTTMSELLTLYGARVATAAENQKRRALVQIDAMTGAMLQLPRERLLALYEQILRLQGPFARTQVLAVATGWMELNANISIGEDGEDGKLMPALDTEAGLHAWFDANPGIIDVHLDVPEEMVNGVEGVTVSEIVAHVEPAVIKMLRVSREMLGRLRATKRIYTSRSMGPCCVIRADGGVEVINNGIGPMMLVAIAQNRPMTPEDIYAMQQAETAAPTRAWWEDGAAREAGEPRQLPEGQREGNAKARQGIDLAGAYRGADMLKPLLAVTALTGVVRGGE